MTRRSRTLVPLHSGPRGKEFVKAYGRTVKNSGVLPVAGAILEAADNFIQLTKIDGYIPGGRLPTLARGRTQRDSRSNTPKTLLLVRAVDFVVSGV